MEETRPVASVQRVEKRVADGAERRTVLSDVSFDLARGTLTVLRGASGSGKTTLLAIVGAMLSPTSGEVVLDGEATSRLRDEHRAEVRRKKVGYLFQDLQLIEQLTALENVTLPCIPDANPKEDVARAHTLLERFGITKLARTRVKLLSGGERQRVALARALVRNPKLLLLDEPTAHLDDAHADTLIDELMGIAKEGRAVLVATHDARIAKHEGVAKVLELANGKLVDSQSREQDA
jgi:putative ABC transport system ATP-binding protein